MRHDPNGRTRRTAHDRAQTTVRACLFLLTAAVCTALPGGSAIAFAQTEPLRVCTTTPDLGSLTREIGGDAVSVTVFVKGTEDPHYAEAKPSFVRALNEADLFIQSGLDLEVGYAPLLLQQARNPRVLPGTQGFLDTSAAIQPLDIPSGVVDRSMGDLHPGGNPHYLLDPLRGLAVARLIATRLGELRPAAKPAFESRFETFQRQLQSALVGEALAVKYGADVAKLALLYQHGKLAAFLDDQGERGKLGGWLGALLPYVGTKAVDVHPIWAYFADRFGLRVVGHLEPLPGVPPTTKHLEQVIELMRAQDVTIVLASAYYDRRYAQLVGDKTGARVLAMANQVDAVPGATTYLAMIDHDVQRVASALRADPVPHHERAPPQTPAARDDRIPSSTRQGTPLIRAEALDLAYGADVVLRGASLEVRRGEFWFLLGGNGSGKTTFLRALLGILPPRDGCIWTSPELGGREGIGFVPQHCEINRSLPTTVREFVSLGLVGLRVARAERPARLERALARVALGDLVERDYWSLSGGQRQRALVARGLIREPSLLILDEPMNHLDPATEETLLRDLLELNRQDGLALLLVTHDVAMAERYATHVATFADGIVTTRTVRTPEELP